MFTNSLVSKCSLTVKCTNSLIPGNLNKRGSYGRVAEVKSRKIEMCFFSCFGESFI